MAQSPHPASSEHEDGEAILSPRRGCVSTHSYQQWMECPSTHAGCPPIQEVGDEAGAGKAAAIATHLPFQVLLQASWRSGDGSWPLACDGE